MKSLYRRAVRWIMDQDWYYWLLTHVIPYIRFTTYYTNLDGVRYHKLYDILQPGDIILTTDRKKLTTLLIPGEFSHAGMCVSTNGSWETSEMTHEDYSARCFFDMCKESDRVVLLRYIGDQDIIDQAVHRCKGFFGTRYDIRFELGVKSLYCSELVYQSYGEGNPLGVSLDDVVGLGVKYISPVGLRNGSAVVVVGDSDLL